MVCSNAKKRQRKEAFDGLVCHSTGRKKARRLCVLLHMYWTTRRRGWIGDSSSSILLHAGLLGALVAIGSTGGSTIEQLQAFLCLPSTPIPLIATRCTISRRVVDSTLRPCGRI